MNIINDNPGVDYLTYFTTQMPKDLAQMATLRDELAKRQGAINAVEAAVADRAAASAVLEAAKAEAKDLLTDAKDKNAAATAKGKDLDTREKALSALRADMEVALQTKANAVAERERRVSSNEVSQTALKNKLQERSDQLNADRAVLDSRVKAFQDKVAALSV